MPSINLPPFVSMTTESIKEPEEGVLRVELEDASTGKRVSVLQTYTAGAVQYAVKQATESALEYLKNPFTEEKEES